MMRSAPLVNLTSSTTVPAVFTVSVELRVVSGLHPAGTPVVDGLGKPPVAGGGGGGGGFGDGLGLGLGDGLGDGPGSGPGAATAKVRIVLSDTPSSSVTVSRTRLVPTLRKVKRSVSPVPSGHCVPPAPSPPSSAQR